jgi:hypothetical protein
VSAAGHFAAGEALLFKAESEQPGSPVHAGVLAQLAGAHFAAAAAQVFLNTAQHLSGESLSGYGREPIEDELA